jgi:hypothetical protein
VACGRPPSKDWGDEAPASPESAEELPHVTDQEVGRFHGGEVAAALHLTTVYVPMPGWLVAVLRIFAYILVLPLSILAVLGLVRAIQALPTPTSRTDAILTLLAFLGALLPILASIFGTR